jgi:hypothetical protein
MTKNANTRLERLNSLLAKADLKIPSYRAVVSESGNNLSWLKKHLLPKLEAVFLNPDATSEISAADIEDVKEILALLPLSITQLKAE